jgi:putative ABC transport system permease protein
VIGGLAGLGIATAIGIAVGGGNFPIAVDHRVWIAGLAAIAVLSLTVGLLPALRAGRLTIVDALAGR